MPTKNVRVVGLTFRKGMYPQNLWDLRDMIEQAQAKALGWSGDGDTSDTFEDPVLEVTLQRQPDNPVDPNAIQVIVPALGRRGWVGFIPAALAARLAPKMDNGLVVTATIEGVYVDPKHEDRPGLEITLEADGPPPRARLADG